MVSVGLLGWLLGRAGYGPSPIVLGLVLGQIAEQGYVRAYMIGNARGDFAGQLLFDRPISWGILLLIVVTLSVPLLRAWRERREARS
jgi:putative tricarboxylic transport membrane protein